MPTRNLADALTQATPTQNGVMTAAQASKLAGIAAEATKNRSDADTDTAIAGAIATHAAAGDPHPQYLTAAEGNAAYSAIGHTHTAAQVGAAPASHTHAIGDVSNLQGTLDGKITRPGGGSAGQSLRVAADGTFEWYTPTEGGATTFLGLADTPASYSGQAGKYVAVTADASGLEYVAGPGALSYPTQAMLWHEAARVVSGSALSHVLDASQRYNTRSHQTSAALGDATEYTALLEAGTYTVKLLGVSGSDGGIADLSINGGASAATFDYYSATLTRNIEKTATITIPTSGRQTIRLTMNTKNASSTAYNLRLTMITLVKQ